MLRTKGNRIVAVLVSVVLCLVTFSMMPSTKVEATQSMKGNFSTNYTLTGDGATDILNVALAQAGKTGSQLGYTEEWCADFVSDCADLAGQSAAVPRYGGVDGLKTRILNAGGKNVTSSPQPGDIVFFSGHVEIVYSGSGSSLKSIGGNTSSASNLYSRKVCSPRVHGGSYTVVRPNYSGNPIPDLNVPTISTDKSSYTVGDTVYLSWTASPSNSNLSHYWLTIAAPDGATVLNETMNTNTSYSFVVSQAGNYTITAFATPYNSANGEGSLTDTKIINVADPKPPSWAKVSLDKKSYKIGEEVVFKLESDIGVVYTVGIDDANGNRLYTKETEVNLDSTTQYYTHIFDKAGNYSCYITTYNDVGLADSERIYFSIYDKPSWAKVSLDKKSYKIGEEVVFKLESDIGVVYTVGIDDADGNRLYTKDTEVNLNSTTQYYTHIFDKAGNYSCYITTYNDVGLADSERIYFSIYDKPSWAKVSLDKKSYKIGEEVVFKLESDIGVVYTVGIDDADGNRLYTKDTEVNLDSTTQYYTHIFDKAGNYSCYITTYNDVGLADSERIFFTISPEGDCNNDGEFNVSDAVLLQKYLLNETTFTETQYNLADLNADGKVNGFDLALLRQKLLA